MIKGVEQARAEQVATLSKIIGITLGNNVLATVEKVEPISPQQREDLLKRTQESLLQLYRSPQTPAVKAQITQLLEQQQLLSSAQLKWVHLQINGRPLLTYTDKPLVAGESVPVQLINAQQTNVQRLVLLDPLNAPKILSSPVISNSALNSTMLSNLVLNSTGAALGTTLNTATSAATAMPADPGFSVNASDVARQTPATVQSVAESHSADRAQTRMLLADMLRNLLPQKDTPRQLYSALPQLQHLPADSRHELLSNTLQQALKTAADQLRSPLQLSNPKLLQMIVKNSGVFFEHKLAAHLQGTSGNSENNPAVITNRLTTQDLKGALLQLLNQINRDLAATGKLPEAPPPASGTAPTAATASVAMHFSNPAPIPTMPGLMQLLHQLPQRSGAELSNKVLRTQLLMLLQQHTLGSLAKVQLQQVHALNHQQNQSDTAQPTQSWLFDIPVKLGQDVHNLEMRLEQAWVDDEKQNGDESDTKIRQWSVTLSFNLPDAGGFYAQLTVVNDTVSAKLWAEQDGTLNEAKIKLDNLRSQLESQGVVVKQLSCIKGTPPSPAISLNYSLVDIST